MFNCAHQNLVYNLVYKYIHFQKLGTISFALTTLLAAVEPTHRNRRSDSHAFIGFVGEKRV